HGQTFRIEPRRTNHTIIERNDQARTLCDLVRSRAIRFMFSQSDPWTPTPSYMSHPITTGNPLQPDADSLLYCAHMDSFCMLPQLRNLWRRNFRCGKLAAAAGVLEAHIV